MEAHKTAETIEAAIATRVAKGQSEADARAGVANALISVAVLTRMAEGQSAQDAIDAVLGAGAYKKLAGDVYDALRAKSEAATLNK